MTSPAMTIWKPCLHLLSLLMLCFMALHRSSLMSAFNLQYVLCTKMLHQPAQIVFSSSSFGCCCRLRREEADRRRAAQREQNAAAGSENRDAAHANGSGNVDQDDNEEADSSERLCVICLENRSNMVFQACGHMCTCNQCSSNLNRCPICRTRTRAIRVYHA